MESIMITFVEVLAVGAALSVGASDLPPPYRVAPAAPAPYILIDQVPVEHVSPLDRRLVQAGIGARTAPMTDPRIAARVPGPADVHRPAASTHLAR